MSEIVITSDLKSKALTWDQIKARKNKPIYCVGLEDASDAGWYIVVESLGYSYERKQKEMVWEILCPLGNEYISFLDVDEHGKTWVAFVDEPTE